MPNILQDRVLESSVTAGLGNFTLAGAVLGFRAFSAVCALADTVPYYIEAVDAVGRPTGEYEFGLGTYSAANILTRTTVRGSSNANAAVNFGAGTKLVGLAIAAPNSPATRLEWRTALGLTAVGEALATAVDQAAARAAIGITQADTGDMVMKARSANPAGWLKLNGLTIGSALSGGTARANADTLDLFTLLWNEFSQAVLAIQTSAGAASVRGASAAADFAANKRLPLFDMRGEFPRGFDDGRGVDAGRVIGSAQGFMVESHSHSVPLGNAATGAGGSPGGVGATVTGNYGGAETRPRNLAFNWFIKL